MDKKRKLKLAKLKHKKPEPIQVTVDMTKAEEAIDRLTELLEDIESRRESDLETFSEHLTSLEGIVKGALQTNNTEPLVEAIGNIKIVSNTKPEINIRKFNVPTPQVKVVNTNDDIYASYKASDTDVGEQNSYYGFLDNSGAWFVLRQSGSDKASFRYAFGNKDYSKNWSAREKLTYGYYSES